MQFNKLNNDEAVSVYMTSVHKDNNVHDSTDM